MTPVLPEEPPDPAFPLEYRNDNIQIHAIDTLDFEGDVIAEDIGDAAC
jgi:hypothetical protein